MNDILMVRKKDGSLQPFDINKVIVAVSKSAERVLFKFTDNDINYIKTQVPIRAKNIAKDGVVTITDMHNIAEITLEDIDHNVAVSYKDYRNYKVDFRNILDSVYKKVQSVKFIGDRSNANTDSAMISTQRSIAYGQLNKELYQKFFLNREEIETITKGYFYIHDMKDRRDGFNCCLCDMANVLKNGFEMGNIKYTEPKSLDVVFDVIADLTMSAASQQYGGFTIPRVDNILAPYAEKSYNIYINKYINTLYEYGMIKSKSKSRIPKKIMKKIESDATRDVYREFEQGFQSWEYKFNTVGSSRGDYPFTSISFGNDTSKWGIMATIAALRVRKGGQGEEGKKKAVLFPKLTFLYDENIHGEGKEYEFMFLEAIECSKKSMYPDYLSLSGEGYIPSMYKKYGKVVSLMGCVDGKELITYKYNGNLYVDSFEDLWGRVSSDNDVKQQIPGIDAHLYINTENIDLTIYDTARGMVKVKNLIRNTSTDWMQVTAGGRTILCTSDHPFHTNNGRKYARDLSLSDTIMHGFKQHCEETKDYTIEQMISLVPKLNDLSANISYIFNHIRNNRLIFLSSLIYESDIDNTGEESIINITTHNKVLALQIMQLIISLDMNANIYKENGYRVEFSASREFVNYFVNNSSIINPTHKESINIIPVKTKSNIVEHNITSVVNMINMEAYSYDVETESDHFEVSGIYSHNCRASLSPWYERGGMHPADEDDVPIFEGRCNLGAISLNLPMILAKSREDNKDFYEVLDYYLEMIRSLHKRTFDYLSEEVASTNPIMFMEGGLLNGNLNADDKIGKILKPMTLSFGITALNELQTLYNGKSIYEDGNFALEVMTHINNRVNQYKEEDGLLYAVYGAPAESLCGTQIQQFRNEYGMIDKVSSREYVSNSFHCGVWEPITPIEKQDSENRFWDLFNGGKIQYCRYPVAYNTEAMITLVRRAMKYGFYEGVNETLSYCDDCGHAEIDMTECCPVCGSDNLTIEDRMNGYLGYTKIKGKSRYNKAKLIEIKERVSM